MQAQNHRTGGCKARGGLGIWLDPDQYGVV